VSLAIPRLYIITDRHVANGRPLADVIAKALAGARDAPGAVAVQLRERDLGGAALLDLACELRALTRAAGVSFFVNDRVDVALAAEADGVHLGSGSLGIDDVRRLAPRLGIAVSAHSPGDVADAAAHGASFAVFGPVFETPSKRAFGPPQGLEALAALQPSKIPVLAVGGISPANVAQCAQAGAAGSACIRAVISATDPANVVTSLLAAFDARVRIVT
jgi:thiamine-phosphate pyrophosphorylase